MVCMPAQNMSLPRGSRALLADHPHLDFLNFLFFFFPPLLFWTKTAKELREIATSFSLRLIWHLSFFFFFLVKQLKIPVKCLAATFLNTDFPTTLCW